MSTFAEQKKTILPYLQRADEIQSIDPKVAYYCRVYAIKQGIAIENKDPQINGVLGALMDKLEQDNKNLTVSDTDAQHCEAFAMQVFSRADKQDRSGKADHNTVRAFYVATIFIDMLKQFGELPEDMVERQQYAAWKAADIRKALREGRTPTPGPAVKDTDLDLDLPDIPGANSGGAQGGLPDLPTIPSNSNLNDQHPVPPPGQDGANFGGHSTHPIPPNLLRGSMGPQQRFAPGSKVFYHTYDGSLMKGTVAQLIPGTPGPSYQVALSDKVIDIREERLAHDFSIGDPILYKDKANGTQKDGTIAKVDNSAWPVAYLITLSDGNALPAVAESLSPIIQISSSPGPDFQNKSVQYQPPSEPPQNPVTSFHLPSKSQDVGPSNLSHYPDFQYDGNQATNPGHERDANQNFPDIEHHGGSFDAKPPSRDAQANQLDDTARSDIASHNPGTFQPPHTGGIHDQNDAHDSPRSPLSRKAGLAGNDFGSSLPDSNHSSRGGSPKKGTNPPTGFPGPQGGFSGPPTNNLDAQIGFQGVPGTFPPGGNFPTPGQVHTQQNPVQPLTSQNQYSQGLPSQTPGGIQNPQKSAYQPNIHVINDAHKVTKTALSALSFEDVPTALQLLNKAIELLTVPGAQKQ